MESLKPKKVQIIVKASLATGPLSPIKVSLTSLHLTKCLPNSLVTKQNSNYETSFNYEWNQKSIFYLPIPNFYFDAHLCSRNYYKPKIVSLKYIYGGRSNHAWINLNEPMRALEIKPEVALCKLIGK
jgi:hypothetical protein